jgi:HEAT repeat protein
MLGTQSSPAEAILRKLLDDPSGAVQVAAADALASQGKTEIALPVLVRLLEKSESPFFALQAANVLNRLGERARPTLPAIKQVLSVDSKENDANSSRAYLQRILERIAAVLEGREQALVYPNFTMPSVK